MRGRLSILTCSTTAELAALQLALQHLLVLHEPEPVVILTNSGGALWQLEDEDRASPLVREILSLYHAFEGVNWNLTTQWIPSHCGIVGNECAVTLASATHAQGQTIFIDQFTVACWLIRQHEQRRHPHLGVAHGHPPTPVPRQRITKAAASLLHRLRMGCAFTNQALHKIGKTSRCDTCGIPENISGVICECPKYSQERDTLCNQLRVAGKLHTRVEDILFPSISSTLAHFIFGAVLSYLSATALDQRL